MDAADWTASNRDWGRCEYDDLRHVYYRAAMISWRKTTPRWSAPRVSSSSSATFFSMCDQSAAAVSVTRARSASASPAATSRKSSSRSPSRASAHFATAARPCAAT